MTLTAAQVRQACDLLRWNSPRLCRAARVPYDVARRARTDDGMSTLLPTDVRTVRAALEKAGVRFEVDSDDRLSVALAKART